MSWADCYIEWWESLSGGINQGEMKKSEKIPQFIVAERTLVLVLFFSDYSLVHYR